MLNSNMPLGSSSSYPNYDTNAPTHENLKGNAGAADLSINSVKDIRRAEMQGTKVSMGEEELIRVIERANKAIQGRTTTFEYSIHKQTKEILVKVLDKDSGEVIREIPPEKILDMVAKMCEMAGIFIDEKR